METLKVVDRLDVGPALDELRSSGAQVSTVFLDASTATLVRRYGDSKHRHPLLGEVGSGVPEMISKMSSSPSATP